MDPFGGSEMAKINLEVAFYAYFFKYHLLSLYSLGTLW